MVEGLMSLMDLPPIADAKSPVNLGSEDEVPMIFLADMVRKTVARLRGDPAPAPIVHEYGGPRYDLVDDPRRRRPDTTKAKALFGWNPKISLAEGIEWMVASWLDAGVADAKAQRAS
jgi:UDP-glucuronate decarboxylase